MRKRCALYVLFVTMLTGAACPSESWISPIAFDSTTAWVSSSSDSVSLLVEVARTEGEQSFGMMDRPALDSTAGMVFLFDSVQGGDKGFWMYRTRMPLDVAFFDSAGVIVSILEMEPCEFQINSDACPIYSPGVAYWSALEVNRGWFANNGMGVGARLRLEPKPE
jgi:uncharacterized membrane protein (UPF0127 family)